MSQQTIDGASPHTDGTRGLSASEAQRAPQAGGESVSDTGRSQSGSQSPKTFSPRDVLWNDVVSGFVGHKADTAARLTRLLDAHPGYVPGLCLKALAQLFLGRRDLKPAAQSLFEQAREGFAPGVLPEATAAAARTLLECLECWLADRPSDAATALYAHVRKYPRDLFFLKLHHGLLFLLGRPSEMRTALEGALHVWQDRSEAAGFVQGLYSFSLEETGSFEESENAGRLAVELAPDDAWGIHAVTHVYETLGKAVQGIEWLDSSEPGYASCNNFLGHIYWHKALLLFQNEAFEDVLELYDTHVCKPWIGDYRDMSNAVSLLWRLESEGVDVGDRWQDLRGPAEAHIADCGSAFALPHYALALARAVPQSTPLHRVFGEMAGSGGATGSGLNRSPEPPAATPRTLGGEQAARVQHIALPLAQAIVDCCEGHHDRALRAYDALEDQTIAIGGSHAQRDLFALMHIDAAIAAGDKQRARELVGRRLRNRPSDPWLLKRRQMTAS